MVLIKIAQGKRVKRELFTIIFWVSFYALIWLFFYIDSKYITVPLGTDICFDDWCASITKIDIGNQNQFKLPVIAKDSLWVVLDVTMSNHAKGIAQKPSDPRIHIIDDDGGYWAFSPTGQQALEEQSGQKIQLGQRLELGQSLSTQLVYKIPANAKQPKVLIEEGPFITKFLFKDNQSVYTLVY
ncbi:hypothetical protein [Mucilaginibacter sp.]